MQILETWLQDGKVFAYCSGNEIDEHFFCHTIRAGGKYYTVLAVDVMVSAWGNVNAVLMLDSCDLQQVSLGEAQICNEKISETS